MGWAWLILVLATYPWLLGAELASDAVASSSLAVFISGTVLIAPSRRLRRWQTVLFAACVGFLFEARRPVPDGCVALTLIGASIFLSANRPLLRNTPGMFRAAVAANVVASLAWLAGAVAVSPVSSADTLWLGFLQLLLSAAAGAAAFVPVTLTQNAVMDRLGVPPAPENA
jgi:hypothetical protein